MSRDFFSEQFGKPMEGEDDYAWHHPFPETVQSTTAYQEMPMMADGMVGIPPPPSPLGVPGLAYTSSSSNSSNDVTGRTPFMDLHMCANAARPEVYGMMSSPAYVSTGSDMDPITGSHHHHQQQQQQQHNYHHPDQQPQQQQQEQQQQPVPKSSSPGSLRSESPDININNDPASLAGYGIRNADGTWRCAHPRCTSKTRFTRACDLRKHFNRHNKYLFCRYDGCPQAVEAGFSNKKDRARHEAKHNPQIACEWQGCERVFSRVDNMKDHVRRIHKKGSK